MDRFLPSVRRKLLIRLMIFVCLMTLLSLVPGVTGQVVHATSRQDQQTQVLANPVGEWNLQVYFQDCSYQGQTQQSQIEMNQNGAWVNLTPYPGGGDWIATGTSTFDYGFTEVLLVNGQFVGYVQIVQQAQLTSSTAYTASGSGLSYDSNGNFLQTCHTQTTATLIA
jgi:hypothetical protein